MSDERKPEGTKRGDPERCRCRECSGCPRLTDRIGAPCPECRSGKHYGSTERRTAR